MIRHISVSVQGLLNNYPRPGSLEGMLSDNDGRPVSDAEAREFLHNCLAKGDKYIQNSECDNFDPQHGCMGHPSKVGEAARKDLEEQSNESE